MKIANLELINETEYDHDHLLFVTLLALRHARLLRWGARAKGYTVRVTHSRTEYATGLAEIKGDFAIARIPPRRLYDGSRMTARDSRYKKTILEFTRKGWLESYVTIIGHEVMHLAGFDATPRGEWVAEMGAASLLNHWREFQPRYNTMIFRLSRFTSAGDRAGAIKFLRSSLQF